MMKSGTTYEQGEIVLAPFPFTDLSIVKQRPLLVISNNDYNKKTDDLLTCGITSNPKETEFSILISNDDLSDGKIPVKSRIKVDKLFTLNRRIIRKKIGKVKNNVFDKVRMEFLKIL